MADLVSYLLTDPLVDDSGAPLDDAKRDANAHRLVDYMRKLKAQQVPQQVQGKPLVEVSCCPFVLAVHD
jgi:COP9 signalosome complex subunit 3